MISPEIIRRYPFFAGLSMERIKLLANAAVEQEVEAGHFFFHEGDDLEYVYLIIEGAVAILLEPPDQEVPQTVGAQLTRELDTREVVVSTVGTGDIFGWSAIMTPSQASAGAKALTRCRVIGLKRSSLLEAFNQDTEFGYLMMQKLADVIRARLRDLRIESLAFVGRKAPSL